MTNDLLRITNINLQEIKKHTDLLDMAMSSNDVAATIARALKIKKNADLIIDWAANVATSSELDNNIEEGETFDEDSYDWRGEF